MHRAEMCSHVGWRAKRRPALPDDWWVRWRDRDPVQLAFTKAHLEHWVGAGWDVFKRNKASKRTPTTWEQVAISIHRDSANFNRRTSGQQHQLNPREFLVMASVLGLPVHELYPTSRAWIARATMLLCGDSATPAEADVYAAYCLSCLTQPTLDGAGIHPHAVTDLCQELGESREHVQAVIVRVTEQLERVLRPLLEAVE